MLTWPKVLPGVRHARHLFPVWVKDHRRDQLVHGLQNAGIGVVVNYRAIHLLTYFRDTYGFHPGDFPVAEDIGDSTVSLPLYPRMLEEHVTAGGGNTEAHASGRRGMIWGGTSSCCRGVVRLPGEAAPRKPQPWARSVLRAFLEFDPPLTAWLPMRSTLWG